MARIDVVMCDVHLENGRRVEAEELPPIVIEGKGPRVLALCPEHKRDYYDPFVELVDDLAQEPPDEDAPEEARQAGTRDAESSAEESSPDAESDGDGTADRAADTSPDDPERVVAESPAMAVVTDQPEAARWDCPVDDCDKSYSASGEHRAEDLKRLGNLHLSTAHHLDKAARRDLLSA